MVDIHVSVVPKPISLIKYESPNEVWSINPVNHNHIVYATSPSLDSTTSSTAVTTSNTEIFSTSIYYIWNSLIMYAIAL